MIRVCGTCKYNSKCFDGFCCGNEEGEFFGCPTEYEDRCENWEDKEEGAE